jgi:signal transduction histidine kinase
MIADPMLHASSPLPASLEYEEEAWMFKDAKAKAHRKRRQRRRGKHRRDPELDEENERSNDHLEESDSSLLSEDERAYRAAQRRADRKVALTQAAVRGALISVALLIFFPFAGFCALLYFCVSLGRRAQRLFYEPLLRERFLQDEVQRRVRTRVGNERSNLAGEQQRSLEQLSASIAHEIRNPITAAKSLVQQLSEDPNGEDQSEYARVAVAELERVERSISHLLRFAREEETHLELVVMEDVLESAIETFRDRCVRNKIEILRQYDATGQLEGDPEQLRRVVINLIGNAMDAIQESQVSEPEIRVSMGENLAGNEVWLRIADNGFGMDDETRERIFDPFFTSREEGTGLGLALSRKIVDSHGGTIEVASKPGEGAEFILTFPKRRPQ